MSFAGMEVRTIYTVYEFRSNLRWYDICSFKSNLAANGYIAFRLEENRLHMAKFPQSTKFFYKVEETQLYCEE